MVNADIIDGSYLVLTLIVTIGMQLFFFAIAATCKFDKVTDIAGSMNFVLLAWLTFALRGTGYVRQLVATILVTVWGLRLGGYLLYRVIRRGSDARFDGMREHCFKFLQFWIGQMLWVWIVSLPMTVLNGTKVDTPLNALDFIGWAVWAIGFIFETLADQSKDWFSNDPSKKGQFININVWSVSRHPNYFGEIMCWIGIFLTSAASYSVNGNGLYYSVLSPVFTYILLMYLSGVPLSEERYDLKYGRQPAYLEYKRRTSPCIPMPTCLYASFNQCTKWLCCCEYAMYSTGLTKLESSSRQTGAADEHDKVGSTAAPADRQGPAAVAITVQLTT